MPNDEAVIRIIIEDGGRGAPSAEPTARPSLPSGPSSPSTGEPSRSAGQPTSQQSSQPVPPAAPVPPPRKSEPVPPAAAPSVERPTAAQGVHPAEAYQFSSPNVDPSKKPHTVRRRAKSPTVDLSGTSSQDDTAARAGAFDESVAALFGGPPPEQPSAKEGGELRPGGLDDFFGIQSSPPVVPPGGEQADFLKDVEPNQLEKRLAEAERARAEAAKPPPYDPKSKLWRTPPMSKVVAAESAKAEPMRSAEVRTHGVEGEGPPEAAEPLEPEPTTAAAPSEASNADATLAADRARTTAATQRIKVEDDYVAAAERVIEAEQRRTAVDREVNRLMQERGLDQQFDPAKEARERRESERKRAQVNKEYERMYGDEGGDKGLQQLTSLAYQFRGVFGGLVDQVVFAVIPGIMAMRRAKDQAAKEGREQKLLDEAQQATRSARGPQSEDIPTVAEVLTGTPNARDVGLGKEAPSGEEGHEVGGKPSSRDSKAAGDRAAGDKKTLPEKLLDAAKGVEGLLGKGGGGKPPTTPTAAAAGGEEAIPNVLPAGTIPSVTAAKGGMDLAGLAAGAAGPLAIVAALKAVDQSVKGSITSGIGTVGGIARGIAGPDDDPGKKIAAAGEVISQFSDKVAGQFGWLGTAAGEAAKALGGVMQELNQTADKYGQYNAQIAQAQAIAEVRTELGNLRRAGESAPDLAKFVQLQSDLQQQFEDIKIRLLSKLLETVNPAMEAIGSIMSGPIGGGIENAIAGLLLPLKVISDAINWIAGNTTRQEEAIGDPTSYILNQGGSGVQAPQR